MNNLNIKSVYINGATGPYNNSKINNDVKYGRNAINNLMRGLETDVFESSDGQQIQSPNNFIVQFVNPHCNNEDDSDWKMGLFGAAYEEMGQRVEVPVDEMTENFKNIHPQISAKALDTNSDKKIDVSEYSSAIILSSILSAGKKLDLNKASDKFSSIGMRRMFLYLLNDYCEKSKGIFATIAKMFDLSSSLKKFNKLKDKNEI